MSPEVAYIYEKIASLPAMRIEQPGLSPETTAQCLRAVNLEAPKWFLDAYAWRNGIYHLNGFLHFLSLEDAVEIYRSYMSFKSQFEDFPWSEGWFPVCDENGHYQICVDLQSGALAAVDVISFSVTPITSHFRNLIGAVHAAFVGEHFSYSSVAGTVSISPSFWAEAKRQFQIEGGW